MSDTTVGERVIYEEPLTLEQVESMPLYEWDIAEIGHRAPPFMHTATAESIADYCKAVRNTNPLYLNENAARQGPFGTIIAPPTYVFKCAPMRRNEVMHAQGYASPEEKRDRATPFAKTEIHFQRPIRLNDTITSVVELAEKYIRRDNQFITWKIGAVNQHGDKVVDYSYTIIWRRAPQDPNAAKTARPPRPAEEPAPAERQLQAITKLETQEAIDDYSELTRVRPRISASLHSDPEFAQRTIFGGTVNMGVATTAYCSEVLEQAFGPGALLKHGSRLEFKGIRPVHAGTRLTLSGEITNEDGNVVDCKVMAHDDDKTLMGIATATVVRNGNS